MNWLRVQTALLEIAGALAAFAANWLLQSTLLIVTGLCIAWLARRRGAAIQSAIYRTTLAAVIVCPLATLLLSLNGVNGWSLPMPAAWRYVESESPPLATTDTAAVVAPPQADATETGDFANAGGPSWDRRAFARRPDDAWTAARAPLPPAGAVPLSSGEPEPITASATPASNAASTSSVRAPTVVFEVFAFGFAAIVISLAWIVGATLLVARLALGWRRLHRMLRQASPADISVQDACQQAAALVGVTAPKVLSSPYIISPCLVGVFCGERGALGALWRSVKNDATSTGTSRNATEGVPYRLTGDQQPELARRARAVILLPELTPTLPLRDVLIHELAHLRRGDAGWNLLARLSEALFFFQPLVWLLSLRLEASAEDVCDDYVVQFGGDRSQYARGLLEIAELSTTPIGATAVAMVSLRSILARRVTRILDSSRTLSTRAGNLLLALVIAGGLAGATVVGFVGLGSHPPAIAEPTPETTSEPQKSAANEKHLETSQSAAKDATDQKPAEAQNEAASSNPVEQKTIRGQVLDPDGHPFAGATIYAIGHYSSPELKPLPLGEAKSGDDGRFELSYPNPIYTHAAQLGRLSGTSQVIAALADGFGPGFISTEALDGKPLTLRLVRDDVPIVGRVLDLEGRPVAGVRVSTLDVMSAKGNDLSAWLEAVKQGEVNWQAAKHLDSSLPEFESTAAPIVTDAQGRYRVSGIGRERVARLRFTGPNIAYTEVDVVTRRIKPLRMVTRVFDNLTRPLYGADLDLPAAPTQAIVGTVRDADTGQPVAGVVVGNNNWLPGIVGNRVVRTVTDKAGHYRLEGLPKTDGIELLAVPDDDQPLFMQEVAVPATATLEPVTVDINLHRGIWITGRVTDKGTGRPVAAQVRYLPFLSNEFAKQRAPEFGLENGPGMAHGVGFHDRYVTAADGAYRLVGLPGRAIVGAICVTRPYRVGVGADTIAGGPDEHGHFPTYHNNFPAGVKWPNSMKEINPPADAKSFACDLELDPGETIRVAVVDANGKPLAGYTVVGDKEFSDPAEVRPEAAFDVLNLGPDETRTVVVRHERLNLGKVVKLRVHERPGRSLTVKLEPCATVKGRLLKAGGDPIAAANVNAVVHPNQDFAAQLASVTTDQEGRFEFTGVPTGCGYDLAVVSVGLSASVARNLQLASGETNDLGDVTVDNGDAASNAAAAKVAQPPSAVAAAKAADDTEAKKPETKKLVRGKAASGSRRLSGRVVDDKTQPIAGAHVRVYRNYWLSDGGTSGPAPTSQWLADTRCDANGRFSAEFEPLSAAAESKAKSRGFSESIGVFVTAKGFGFGLQHAEPAVKEQIELHLPRDFHPIEGRVLNLEGRAVQGARVAVRAVGIFDGEPDKLDDWLAQVRAGGAAKGGVTELPNGVMTIQFDSFLNPFPTATTDAAGRFTIASVGADRVAYLKIEGAQVAGAWLPVVTRDIEPLPLASGLLRFASQTCYGDRCNIVVPPEQPIRGVVRDAETGEPLKNVEVRFNFNDDFFTENSLSTTTGADGRYELRGLAKPFGEREVIELRVIPAVDQAYFRTELNVPRQAGLDAVTCDVPLRRAIMLRGKVTDRKTGAGVRAAVRYYPFLSNAEAARYANFKPGVRKIGDDDRYATDAEGRFAIPAVAGRGVLTVVAERGDRYAFAEGADTIAGFRRADQNRLNVYHLADLNRDNAYRDVNIPADAKELTLNVELAPLPVTRLSLVDEIGRELRGVETQGLAPMNPFVDHWSNSWREPRPTSSAELFGPEAGETRETLFLHRALNLGAMIRFVSADSGAPEKHIVLRPCGSLRGRIVDRRGKGVAGAWVNAAVIPGNGTAIPGFRWRLTVNQTAADADGRFELKAVPPGARYAVEAYADKRAERWQTATAEIKPGGVADLGDIAPQAAENNASDAAADVAPPPPAVAAVKAAADDLITVTGTVVDPQGKPFAGAKLFAARWYWEPHIPHPPLAETTSDAQGHFTISYRKSQFNIDVGREDQWKEVSIAATADGFGAAWVTWRDIPRGEHPTLRLVADDVPIAGRVVDLEGKPVAGVMVRVGSIHTGKGGNLDDWLAAVRRGEFPWTAAKHLDDSVPKFDSWPLPVITGDDGRFRVNGLGRERRVHLSFSGPAIAYQEVKAVTRRSDMFPLKFSLSENESNPVYGAEFELVAPPTQAITGVVRDAKTRQPLAGVSIESNMFAGSNFINTRQLRAVSDAEGRYRLVGMPKGTGNRVLAVPNDDQPYLMRDFKVPESRGLAPVELDIELHRGVWITGRVTDLRSGAPIVARLHYLPFLSNDFARQTPEFGEPGSADGFQDRYVSRLDGAYRLVGLPGRAIVGAECVIGRYRQGVGAEQIAGTDKRGNFETYFNPVAPGKKWPNAMKEINPSPETETVVCDLALDPGEKLTVNVVDPKGQPLDGFETHGSGQSWYDSRELHGSFDVITLDPDETRTVIIRHTERKLGKVIRVRLAEHPAGSLSVTAEPTAKIIGRLVDRQGTPLSGAAIEAWLSPLEDFAERLPPATTDGEGRFEYTDIPTGCHYDFEAKATGMKQPGWFAEDVGVEPGKTKDLGDVVYGGAVERNRQSSTKVKSAEKVAGDKMPEQRNVAIRGKVLLPDGKPAGGAHVAVIGQRTAVGRGGDNDWGHDILGKADADENGAYVLRLKGVSQQTHHYATLIARQGGSAIAWKQVNLDAAEAELTIELMPEAPLRGRLIDVEGQPAAGVRLSIAWIGARAKDRADGGGTGYRPADHVPPAWIAPVWSDKEGRFVVHGLAAEQGVTLQVTGDDRFAQQTITINTGMSEERGKTDATYRPLIKNAKPGEEVVLALAPAKIFEGTVRYADSGKAVPQARVSIWASQQEPHGSMISLAGTADEHGHYHITPWAGIRFGLIAYPPQDTPYLARQTPLSEAILWKGGEPLKKVEMTLPRGVLLRGTVVEAGSGAPISGAAVQYHPESSNNRNASDDILTGWQCMEVTDNEGRFTLAVLPGPGRLLVNGQQGKYVFQEFGGRELDSGKPGGTRNYVHAVAKLNPQVGDDALEMKLELKPGATVKGRMVDERGNAIEEALVISRLNISPYVLFWRGHTTPTLGGRFELSGLAEGVEYPVYFLDSKRRLGATEIIKAGDNERTVVLKPCGEATLRLIDEKGEPVPGNYGSAEMVVTPGAAKFDRAARERGELLADADFIANIDRANHPLEAAGDDGRRRLTALIPGATYRIMGKRGGEIGVVKEFQVQSKETLDLGEIKVEKE